MEVQPTAKEMQYLQEVCVHVFVFKHTVTLF